MKKLYLLLIAALLCGFVASSCTESESNEDPEENFVDPEDPEDETSDATTITLNVTEVTLAPTETFTLTATVTPDPTVGITWKSSNSNYVTVFMGTITAVGVGEATITCTTDTGESATCAVTVAQSDYQLVWSEEFDGDVLDTSIWNPQINGNGSGNNEKQYYTDRTDNLRLEDGLLIIEARKENYDWAEYTSGRITTSGNADFAYGKIEASIDLPAGGGLWPAFWMMGYGSWPSCGEIDILEYVGNNPGYVIHALHTSLKNGTAGNNWSSTPDVENLEEGFHTFAIEWEYCYWGNRDIIKFYVDGVKTAEYYDPVTYDDDSEWPFNDQFFILLNLAVGGSLGGTIDDSIFDNEVLMKVDYVRVYQRL